MLPVIQNSPVEIPQNSLFSFVTKLLDLSTSSNPLTADPYNLTTATAITTCFQNADGTELMISLGSGITILNAVLGKIKITLTAAQTALLEPVQAATLELAITITGNTDPFKVLIPNAYSVLQTVC